jgi:hypothetical protein
MTDLTPANKRQAVRRVKSRRARSRRATGRPSKPTRTPEQEAAAREKFDWGILAVLLYCFVLVPALGILFLTYAPRWLVNVCLILFGRA